MTKSIKVEKQMKQKMSILGFSFLVFLLMLSSRMGDTGAFFQSEDEQTYGAHLADFAMQFKEESSDGLIRITNKEKSPGFIRVLVQPNLTTREGIAKPSKIGKEIVGKISEDWIDGGDGYYYYLKKVSSGKQTAPLFSERLTVLNSTETMSLSLKVEGIVSSGKAYHEAWWNGVVPTEGPLKEIDTKLEQEGV